MSETNVKTCVKNRKISVLDFYDVLDFFAIDCTCVFIFCPPKTDSDNWEFE
jgi:hypothetical protein